MKILIHIVTFLIAAFLGAAVLMWFVSDSLKWGYSACLDVTLAISVLIALFQGQQAFMDAIRDN